MKKETSDKLYIKVAALDDSIILMAKIAALNKLAIQYAQNPALTAIGDVAKQDTAQQNNARISPAQPTAAQTLTNAVNQAGIQTGAPAKPTYMDALKQKAGQAWDWTKGQWNKLSPETRQSIQDIGAGTAGALAINGIAGLIPGVKKSKIMRALALIGGGAAGIGLSRYLSNPANRQSIADTYKQFTSKLKG
jgi:hypothetical protein